MKNLILITGLLVIGINASASDQMADEIVCNKILQPGEADNGLTVILKSNDFSWVKLVQIIENGYLGSRVLANVQVPLNPKIVPLPRGNPDEVDITYAGEEATLKIRAYDIGNDRLPLNGYGSIALRLPGYEPEVVPLHCEYAE